MHNSTHTVIVGSGLSALMLARMIKLYRDPEASIIIIEREKIIGGQYGSYDYGQYGLFDIGMHIYYESTIPEIDRLFTDLLDKKEWNILEGNRKDIQGLFYNGKLQTNTPCVDLRNISKEKWGKYIADIFSMMKGNKGNNSSDNTTAYDVLSNHFGKLITDEVFVPVLEKLYKTDPRNLDPLATLFTPLTRVALFDKEIMLDLMKSATIRDRICYPDQLTLPPYRTNDYRGFYPKEFGMIKVLGKLKKQLEEQGVLFLTGTTITHLEVENKIAKSLSVIKDDGQLDTIFTKEIFWTAGLPSLAIALKINLSDLVNDKKHTEAMYVNILVDKKPAMGELYYFFCFDKGYRSFRVTNYSNYCPAASGQRGYPLCIEFWAEPGDSKKEEDITSQVIEELKSFGVIDDSYKLLFSKVEKLTGVGFPLPSVTNINNMKEIGKRISSCEIRNIIPTGVLSEKNVFFIKDVLIDTYKKVINFKNEI